MLEADQTKRFQAIMYKIIPLNDFHFVEIDIINGQFVNKI